MSYFILTHGLKNIPNYYFSGEDLMVLEYCSNNRTKKTKVLKKQFNGRNRSCRGWFINGKFMSLTNLEKKKYPIIKIILNQNFSECPF